MAQRSSTPSRSCYGPSTASVVVSHPSISPPTSNNPINIHHDLECNTPTLFDSAIWKTSGHWAHYKDDMFRLEVEKREWALKPMNCPGHFVLFGHRDRSYRELPMRIADFGVLHRNEASGALSGLTRVRRFCQDDAHSIVRCDQVCFRWLYALSNWLTVGRSCLRLKACLTSCSPSMGCLVSISS